MADISIRTGSSSTHSSVTNPWCRCRICEPNEDRGEKAPELCDHCLRYRRCDSCGQWECDECRRGWGEDAIDTQGCANGCGLNVWAYCGLTCAICNNRWCDETDEQRRRLGVKGLQACHPPLGYFCSTCTVIPRQPTALYVCYGCYDNGEGLCLKCHEVLFDPLDDDDDDDDGSSNDYGEEEEEEQEIDDGDGRGDSAANDGIRDNHGL